MYRRVSCLILLFSLVLVLASCNAPVEYLPTSTAVAFSPGLTTPVPPDYTPQPALLERRQMVLEWPKAVREKDSDWIVLSIQVDPQGNLTATAEGPGHTTSETQIEIPDLYATHNIVALARLDMAGMEAYREDIRQPLSPGRPVVFRWSIRANEAGLYRGVVWLHLELVPKNGGPIDELLLLARPIEIQAVTVLGLPGDVARILGGLGVVVSAVLGYPAIQRWVGAGLKRMRRRKSAVSQPGNLNKGGR